MLNINDSAPRSGDPVDRGRGVARLLLPLLGMTAILGGFFGVVYFRTPARAQMRFAQQGTNHPSFARGQGFGRGGMQQEQKLVRQFDNNGDGCTSASTR